MKNNLKHPRNSKEAVVALQRSNMKFMTFRKI